MVVTVPCFLSAFARCWVDRVGRANSRSLVGISGFVLGRCPTFTARTHTVNGLTRRRTVLGSALGTPLQGEASTVWSTLTPLASFALTRTSTTDSLARITVSTCILIAHSCLPSVTRTTSLMIRHRELRQRLMSASGWCRWLGMPSISRKSAQRQAAHSTTHALPSGRSNKLPRSIPKEQARRP